MAATEPVWALGLMSGTSLDGVDAALLRTDGHTIFDVGPDLTIPYDQPLRDLVRSTYGGGGPVVEAARALTLAHAETVEMLLDNYGIARDSVEVVGFHGQTILHEPAEGRTVQIGDGDLLAARTGLLVVDDFRSADVAAGGEGAPLAPLFHAALAAGLPDSPAPLAVLNLGGVANVTWIAEPARGADSSLMAFDTGPANAVLDDWMAARRGVPYDADGGLALSGRVDEGRLATLLDNPYFRRRPPKSLDRGDFDAAPLERLLTDDGSGGLEALSDADGAATLAAFTAASVVRALAHLPVPPALWIACGGGRHNRAIMRSLETRLSAPVVQAEVVGWHGDALEAQAFAFLAVRALRGLPLSIPETTGVGRPTLGGRIHTPPIA
ncbi:MAG: anhydro-N-acetylmuramic acid kinase [Proteobacteria bacterium]|nr:anhydro-N-acetylmuramic acid kinase [Pseudomonadota bacterium]